MERYRTIYNSKNTIKKTSLLIDNSIKKHNCFIYLTISTTLSAWWKAKSLLQLVHSTSSMTPLWNNSMFIINKKPFLFLKMKEKGILNLGNIFEKDSFMTFEQLQNKYDIPECTHYQYNQLKEAMKGKFNVNNFKNCNHILFEKLYSLPLIKLLSYTVGENI